MFLYLTILGTTNDSSVLLLEANSKYILGMRAIYHWIDGARRRPSCQFFLGRLISLGFSFSVSLKSAMN